MKDVRGRNIHSIRLSNEVKQIICEHCHSIPHSESHYSREKSKLKYFDSDLSLTTLYKLFLEYYTKKTGNENPLFQNRCTVNILIIVLILLFQNLVLMCVISVFKIETMYL